MPASSGGTTNPGRGSGATRVIALVGPAGAGKTSLAEAMLFAAGAIDRQGSVAAGTTIGDSSPEARQRGGSTELNLMQFDYLGDPYAIIDSPGSVGFAADAARAVALADLAIVVVDPDPARAPLAAPALRLLDEQAIPHLIFINRIDGAQGRIRDLVAALQPMSVSPLIARQVPIRDGDRITGFVDLASERAWHYEPGKPSARIDLPPEVEPREREARTHLLESLADHDDALMEQLLMDEVPAADRIFADLKRETGDNLGISVLFGAATNGWGVRRLLKALRHETPPVEVAERRLGVTTPALHVAKVSHGGSVGRLALARALGGPIAEGREMAGPERQRARIGALFTVQGDKTVKLAEARRGDMVAIAKADAMRPGQWWSTGTELPELEIEPVARNHALAIEPVDRKDDVKLSGALARLLEEDPALAIEQDEASHELRLKGINDEHLRTVLARLERRYGVAVSARAPSVGYRESIRRTVTRRGRHKKQSGGHGQFGDVVIELAPLARGDGFRFAEKISGGSVPRQYFPAVEAGVRDAMARGPLGFAVVDVAVTLLDGSFHSVDSSELAFRLAGRLAMHDALAEAAPHLLEPVQRLTVVTPAAATSKISSALSSRRGQMLGMGPRDGWTGWDRIEALLPERELAGLEAELRSLSHGLASYDAAPDHLADLGGPIADKVVKQRISEPT